MRQRSGPGFATGQTNSAWSLAQRKKDAGIESSTLLEPNPTMSKERIFTTQGVIAAKTASPKNQQTILTLRHPAAISWITAIIYKSPAV